MPGGLLVTLPEPGPSFTTLSVARRDPGPDDPAKLAVQVFSMSSVTLPSAQSGSPLQLTNLAPGAGVAVSVTTVPCGKLPVQVSPHSIPAGSLVTVPEPVPSRVTVSATKTWNVAVQASSAFRVTVPSAQSGSPLQPAKTEPGAGIAVKLTTAPNGNRAEQLAPQSSPAGSLVTVPLPVPAFVTPRVAKSPPAAPATTRRPSSGWRTRAEPSASVPASVMTRPPAPKIGSRVPSEA